MNEKLTNEGKEAICNSLSDIGFSMHEDAPASSTFATLGGVIDGEIGQVRATPARMWNLILAFMHIRQGSVHPEVVQRLLGHAMVVAVLNRAGMSIFHRLYKFAKSTSGPRPLNNKEKVECFVFAGIIPLLFADLRRDWSDEVHCTDASPDGFGVCSTFASVDEVQNVGRWNERWRYKRLPPQDWQPRRRAMALDVFSDVSTVSGTGFHEMSYDNYIENPLFEEVPNGLLHPSRWSTKMMCKWEHTEEHITLKEGRALVLCVRRLSRSYKYRNKRHMLSWLTISGWLWLLARDGLLILTCSVSCNSWRLFHLLVTFLSKCCGYLRRRTFQMAHRAAKSSRVLSSHGVSKKNSKPQPDRMLRTVKSQIAPPMPKKQKRTENVKKKTAVLPSSHWQKKAPPAMRQVGRLPCREEPNIGRRARSNQLTVLEQRSLSKEIQHQYLGYYNKFRSFCLQEGLAWPPGDECDLVMADYLDILFLEDRSANEGEKLLAALEFHHVELKGKMFRSKRALKGWRKEKPPKSRLPLPACIAYGIAMDLIARGKRVMGLKVLMDFDAYLRPGESLRLKVKDIIKPVRGAGPQFRFYSIIREQEDLVADKTGIFDNTVLFNTPGREFVGEMMWSHSRTRNHVTDNLFSFTAEDFRREFQLSGSRLGVQKLHPYQLRHGEASDDMNAKIWDHAAIKQRGRWHTDQSVRRYAKIGKLQQMLNQLSQEAREYCQWSKSNMVKVARGSLPAKML